MEKVSLRNETNIEYAVIIDDKVTEVSKGFTELTSYTSKDMIGKDLAYIFTLIRVKDIKSLADLESIEPVYIFTKYLEPRYVKIYYCSVPFENSIICYFEEIPNTRIFDRINFIEQLYRDTKQGFALFNVPELILLRANNQYLDFLMSPFNDPYSSIGICAEEIFKAQSSGKMKLIFDEVVKTRETVFLEGYKHYKPDIGTTYWDFTLAPILEDGEVKYIAAQAIDVTEKIINRKLLELQRRELGVILEDKRSSEIKDNTLVESTNI